ncbi:ABC efflux pump, inner membrane subunit [Methanohalobium evestigatum Z-7303]|uniref:ABC efflux pump, inner membrane subunit n=2 Tax=Methanohalobium evestigatum TaxID=2322 RepID=D7E9T3_METEZ|nr:ABC efflux pump, inner membrane subunit [Methanohalobium evestigatum Z-7303]
MVQNLKNTFVIAQKEFADNLWSPRFILMVIVFTLVVFSSSYNSVNSVINVSNFSFLAGFLTVTQTIAIFLPLLGFALGFDSVVKEKKSASLNIFLTHPVYRDNIITGKISGAMITLLFVVFISVVSSVGTNIIISGMKVGWFELERTLIFAILTYLYMSIFLALGIFISTSVNSEIKSLIYGICTWLVLCVIYSAIVVMIASAVTGQSPMYLNNNDEVLDLNEQLTKLSPVYHYAKPVQDQPGLTTGGVSRGKIVKNTLKLFDNRYTLIQWLEEYWENILVLTVTPLILLIMSYISFLRQDINGE